MVTCIICNRETRMDDVVTGDARGWCICLTCFERAIGITRLNPVAGDHGTTGRYEGRDHHWDRGITEDLADE